MGLDERRALKTVQDELIPKTKSALKEMSGADIAVELDENSFMTDEFAKSALDNVKSGMDETLAAVKDISKDAMGKESLQKGLKKIVFKHLTKETMSHREATMAGGVLTVANYWGSSGYTTAKEIQKIIEREI